MTYPSFAVIGTAGRREDKIYLTQAHYSRMVNATYKLINHLNINRETTKFYSGGAAWADHLLITLSLQGILNPENITIYLPSHFSDQGHFVNDKEEIGFIEKTTQHYHRLFKDVTGVDGIKDLVKIRSLGAVFISGNSNFHARNSLVAKAVSPDGVLLAFTFGQDNYIQVPWSMREFTSDIMAQEAGLKDGGTADTWNKCKAKAKWHCKIGRDI